jgi:peptidoglycan-associated lipoprotein
MLLRTLVLLSAVFMFTACSTTDDEVIPADQASIARDGISNAPLDEIYQGDGAYNGQGPAPGTQADLTVNVGDRVFFGTDSYDLTGEARTQLERQATWLQQYSNLSVTVEGHADERGTREYNLALGARRAESVKNYLIALGVDPRQVEVISYGKERPAVPGADESAWAQNRRGVTKVN